MSYWAVCKCIGGVQLLCNGVLDAYCAMGGALDAVQWGVYLHADVAPVSDAFDHGPLPLQGPHLLIGLLIALTQCASQRPERLRPH